MKQRPRIYYTESQKKLMWDHWQKGDSLQHIAQLFDRNHSSIQRILAETGGNYSLRSDKSVSTRYGHRNRYTGFPLGSKSCRERPECKCDCA